jgi:5-methylcytosine-specific restriction protein B
VLVTEIAKPTSASATEIRAHLRVKYLDPARRRGETLVTIVAGDIHKELGLRNRVPSVCQVMESKVLEREAGVKVSSKQGPPSGRGTTFTVTYLVEPSPAALAADPDVGVIPPYPSEGDRLFYELRGKGKEMYAKYGGGEAWLKKERANFYGPFKRKKML